MARQQNPSIREFILKNVQAHPDGVASLAAKEFKVSRTSVARYMSRLIDEGIIIAEGKTRARKYKLNEATEIILLNRDGFWNEDTVWRERLRPLMNGIRPNIIDLYQYGFTEMLNNVLDHSGSPDVSIFYTKSHAQLSLTVMDKGIGIFKKIQQDFRLEDARTALLELSKGKITSDRKNHSGEGIYFTSRMFDKFSIMSGHLYYSRSRRDGDDWIIEAIDETSETKGTYVTMKINTEAEWTPRDVFDRFQGDDVYFRKTHVPVSLGRYPGEQLVSRSQAKRILTRFPDFSEVILDFMGVAEIGQGFADEIFRVFKNSHPDTFLAVVNTNEDIDRMIKYVQTADPTLKTPGG